MAAEVTPEEQVGELNPTSVPLTLSSSAWKINFHTSGCQNQKGLRMRNRGLLVSQALPLKGLMHKLIQTHSPELQC